MILNSLAFPQNVIQYKTLKQSDEIDKIDKIRLYFQEKFASSRLRSSIDSKTEAHITDYTREESLLNRTIFQDFMSIFETKLSSTIRLIFTCMTLVNQRNCYV